MSENVTGERERPKLLRAAEILSEGQKQRDFLVERPAQNPFTNYLGLIPENSYTLLTADPNHGKTWAALELARLLATPVEKRPNNYPGRWLGVYDVKHRGVLYLDEENGQWLIGRRLRQLGLPEDGKIGLWSHARLRLDRPDDVKEIGQRCRDEELQVVFIDSLVRFHLQDENDAAKIGMVGNAIRTLVEDEKLTVIALHHNRKAQGPAEMRMRGSNEIMAAADTVLNLKSLKGRFVLSVTKMRYSNKDHFQNHWFTIAENIDDDFRLTHGWEKFEIDHEGASNENQASKNQAMGNAPKNDEFIERVYERVCKLIAHGDTPNVTNIRAGLGNNKNVGDALKVLVEKKWLWEPEKGRSKIYLPRR